MLMHLKELGALGARVRIRGTLNLDRVSCIYCVVKPVRRVFQYILFSAHPIFSLLLRRDYAR